LAPNSTQHNMTEEVNILKSEEDKRTYRYVTLENELQILLIRDAHTEKASAAMDVHVGFYSDPDDVQGLAHFCEHMLFLGTEKYPDEKTYINYLSKHGGSWNAFTSSENTNFYFDVSSAHLEGALDRFAQFFISPLFTQDATDREMNAVHSEHCKNLQNDYWRESQLLRSTSNPNYPYHKFGTGSLETLKKHTDIRDRLLKYHSAFYSSNIMKLVIYGCESLDQLEIWAREKFSPIKNKHVTVPKFEGEPFPPDFLRIRQHHVPVKDLHKVTLLWPILPQRALWQSKPGHVLGHLLVTVE
jgi:insulysin